MKKRSSSSLIYSALLASVLAFPLLGSAADTTTPATDASAPLPVCKDGTTATHTGKGACSHHGGVNKTGATSTGASSGSAATGAAPAAPASPAAPAATDSSAAGGSPLCKDGTTATHTGKGACSHHGGVNKTGVASTAGATGSSGSAVPPAAAPAPSAPAPQPAAASTAAPSHSTSAPPAGPSMQAQVPSQAAAPGGGPGQVWVNSASKVYHCSGDRWYGKTKQGQYMTEADAQAQGTRPDHNKPCS
jgi:hypothetical protein